jgi:hypothetical protein
MLQDEPAERTNAGDHCPEARAINGFGSEKVRCAIGDIGEKLGKAQHLRVLAQHVRQHRRATASSADDKCWRPHVDLPVGTVMLRPRSDTHNGDPSRHSNGDRGSRIVHGLEEQSLSRSRHVYLAAPIGSVLGKEVAMTPCTACRFRVDMVPSSGIAAATGTLPDRRRHRRDHSPTF